MDIGPWNGHAEDFPTRDLIRCIRKPEAGDAYYNSQEASGAGFVHPHLNLSSACIRKVVSSLILL
jgi:hypothetical protein